MSAHAGSLRTTFVVEGDAVRVERQVADDAPASVALDALPRWDADGTVLNPGVLPALARHRSVVFPEGGGFAFEAPVARVRLRLPTSGAAGTPSTELRRLPVDRAGAPVAPAAVVLQSGPTDKRLDLVFLADGYTADEETKFNTDVQAVVDHLAEIEPWSAYLSLLNVWKVWTPSQDSGIDQDDVDLTRTTALGCGYGCDLLGSTAARLICCDEPTLLDVIDTNAPFADGVMVMVNESRYGGSGGLLYSTSYTGDSVALKVAAHELGHTLLTLWDEYSYDLAQPRDQSFISPNCNVRGEAVSWEDWLDLGPIDWAAWDALQERKITRPQSVAGVDCDGRAGGNKHDAICAYPTCSFTDWVRPTKSACMMNALQDAYCPVCREAIVQGLWAEVGGPLLSATPAPDATVKLDTQAQQAFHVEHLVPGGRAEVVWTLGGQVLGTGPDLTILGSDQQCGELVATVRDRTDWVRDDLGGTLTATATWRLQGERCCGCQQGGGMPASIGVLMIGWFFRRRPRWTA